MKMTEAAGEKKRVLGCKRIVFEDQVLVNKKKNSGFARILKPGEILLGITIGLATCKQKEKETRIEYCWCSGLLWRMQGKEKTKKQADYHGSCMLRGQSSAKRSSKLNGSSLAWDEGEAQVNSKGI